MIRFKKLTTFLVIAATMTISLGAQAKVEAKLQGAGPEPYFGVAGSNGAGIAVVVTGKVKKVSFSQINTDEVGNGKKVVIVTVNESKLPSGEVTSDTIYFTDSDIQLGLSLIGAMGKKITVDRDGNFTIFDQ